MAGGVQFSGSYITFDTEANLVASIGRPGDVGYALDTDMRYKSNGTAWFPTDALRVIRSQNTISMTATGATKIITLPPTVFRFIALAAHVELISLTGTVITPGTISVGTNSTAYNNIFSNSAVGSSSLLGSVGLVNTNALTIAQSLAALNGSTDIYARVNLAEIGASVQLIRIDMMGYYEV